MKVVDKHYDFKPHSGQLLLSEPFLGDPNFRKSVVLLCEHEAEGSVGFVLNKPMEAGTDEVIPGLLTVSFPLYYGGPVEQNTLHFIHRVGKLVDNSVSIAPDLFWGGDIEQVEELILSKRAGLNDFRFFIGYSGWGEGQLNAEIDQKAWWLTSADTGLVFDEESNLLWQECVRRMGSDFAYLADSPEDYSWN